MLILSRRQNEVIVIDNKIRVHVIEITRGVVRLGVDAPSDVVVDREEVDAAKRNGNRRVLD